MILACYPFVFAFYISILEDQLLLFKFLGITFTNVLITTAVLNTTTVLNVTITTTTTNTTNTTITITTTTITITIITITITIITTNPNLYSSTMIQQIDSSCTSIH